MSQEVSSSDAPPVERHQGVPAEKALKMRGMERRHEGANGQRE